MRKFLHLFHKEVEFRNIEGYDDIKDIVRRALNAEDIIRLVRMRVGIMVTSSSSQSKVTTSLEPSTATASISVPFQSILSYCFLEGYKKKTWIGISNP